MQRKYLNTFFVANIRKSPLRGRTDTVPSVAAYSASDAGGVGWRSTEITCAGATENGTLGYRVDVHGSDSAIRIRCGASQGERRTLLFRVVLIVVIREPSQQSCVVCQGIACGVSRSIRPWATSFVGCCFGDWCSLFWSIIRTQQEQL